MRLRAGPTSDQKEEKKRAQGGPNVVKPRSTGGGSIEEKGARESVEWAKSLKGVEEPT